MVDVCFVVFPTQLYTTSSAVEVLRGCNRVCVVEDPYYYKTSKAISIGFSMACEAYVKWLKLRGIMAGFINIGKILNVGGVALNYFTGTTHQIWMWELENPLVYNIHPTQYTFAGVGIKWLRPPRYIGAHSKSEIETALSGVFNSMTAQHENTTPIELTPTVDKKIAARVEKIYNDGRPVAPVYIDPVHGVEWLTSKLSTYKSGDINRVGFMFRTGQRTYIQVLEKLPWCPRQLLKDIVCCMHIEATYHMATKIHSVTKATPAMPLYTAVLQRAMMGHYIDQTTLHDAIAYGVVSGLSAVDVAEFFKKTPWWSNAHAHYAACNVVLDRKIDNTYTVLLDLYRRKQSISPLPHSSGVPSTIQEPASQQVQSGQ